MDLLRRSDRHLAAVPDATAAGAGSARREFLTVHGYRRAFLRVGEGPPLLLLHGIGDSATTWEPLLPLLARRYTVIAPDLLGHGQSDRPRADYSIAAYANGMRDLLGVLGIDRVTVVGHSLGGGVAMQLAYQYPDRVERLVLVSTGGVGRTVNPALRVASLPGTDSLLALLRLPAVRLSGLAGAAVLGRLPGDLRYDLPDLLRIFDALPDAQARSAVIRTLRAVVDWRGQVVTMLDRCYLAQGMPTLVVWGRHDTILPVEHADVLHRAMPGSRLEVFESSGHFPHRCEPERFVDVLDGFVRRTPPADHDADQWRRLLRCGRPHDDDADDPTTRTLADSQRTAT